VVGIGLNVNQTRFDPSLPNPTSLALETGRGEGQVGASITVNGLLEPAPPPGGGGGRRELQLSTRAGAQIDIFDLFAELYRCLMVRYALLLEQDWERIEGDYNNIRLRG